jgi:cytochrome c oxidase assembly protein subunit 15
MNTVTLPTSIDTPLYSLAPLWELLLIATTLALGVILLWRRKVAGVPWRQQMPVLCLLTLMLCFELVIFGAFTRLSDSGLGCPDWPGCYGAASPFGAYAEISEAQSVMPTGPVTHTKAWIEMIHRYLAMTLGALIVLIAVLSMLPKTKLRVFPWLPWITLIWVLVQGAFGAWTVTLKLQPIIVTLHLLGGMFLLVLLRSLWQAYRLHQDSTDGSRLKISKKAWCLVMTATLMLWLQIALGGWVSSNYAVMACSDYPLCQGSVWPAMDFQQGFTLWRPLGYDGSGAPLSMPALTAIHFTHRWFALPVFILLGFCAWYFRHLFPKLTLWLVLLLCTQFATGLVTVFFHWPLLAALLHNAGAAALVLLTTTLLLKVRR